MDNNRIKTINNKKPYYSQDIIYYININKPQNIYIYKKKIKKAQNSIK